ncbi:MAG: UDP-N-acetylglucosamine 1-carboxyvinyltransferase [Lachnospiraceae bacterium]|nr:UDP-N-acetylglucosamine 1-carboxyvinyltransferase [Lachnospiraceae bacterium]
MQYYMKGGNPLVGDVYISGAKNAALGILPAAIMADETVIIDNVPDVSDIHTLCDAMSEIGVLVATGDNHTYTINGANISKARVDNEHIRHIRAGYYLLGALLGKYHHAEVALPGGCNIGSRPIDQHLKGFRALGATAEVQHGIVIVDGKNLHGGHVYLDMVSVGATVNIMLAAALAPGNTVIENAAKEPHVVDIANLLNRMGANIRGAGTDIIKIRGVDHLHGTDYSVIPDQIEAGTYMFAAAITQGDVMVHNIIPQHMDAISSKLIEMGCEVSEFDEAIRVVGKFPLHPCNVKTLPYPGFPTDMQPQICVALAKADGRGVITESIFESRFKYVDELTKMGAHIKVEGNVAVIDGVPRMTGAQLEAPDLRAGAALVLAGLGADGWSSVSNVDFIMRGYENFIEKLKGLGAEIECVSDEREARKFRFRVG